jgi:uncharacterized RDD family membrane protein YckC
MTPEAAGAANGPRGYLTEQGKRSYTILVGVLAVVAFVAQFVLPMLVIIVLMPSFMTMGAGGFRQPDLVSAAVWRGFLWYPERTFVAPGGEGGPSRLERVRLVPGAEKETIDSGVPADAVLLAGDDALWILSGDGVSACAGETVRPVRATSRPGRLTSPFLLDGKPAAVVARPAGYSIVVLVDGAWKERWSVPASSGAGRDGDLRAVAASGVVHLFLSVKDEIFHKTAGADPEVPLDDSWQAVNGTGSTWGALDLGGVPAVFTGPRDGTTGSLRVFRPSGSGWESFAEITSPAFAVSNAVFPAGAPGSVYVASAGAFGNGRVVLLKEGRRAAEVRFGDSPFPGLFRGVFMGVFGAVVAIGLGFAIVLSFVMPRFRPTEHATETQTIAYAPVWRRALAQLIDAVVLCGPLAWGYFSLFSGFGSLDESFGPSAFAADVEVVLAGFLWLGAGFLIISFLEGHWGVTPGKLVLGIRTLGTDLRPCGFGRAFLRNLLTFVDGFFYFLVGLLLVALTEHWQRVGDLVARTVVVRAGAFGSSSAGPRPNTSACP